MNNYMWLLFIGTFFSAFSQLLLKQSANKHTPKTTLANNFLTFLFISGFSYFTVTLTTAFFPLAVLTVILHLPFLTAFTTPFFVTLATFLLEDLKDLLLEKGVNAHYFPSFEEIEKFLSENCVNGDLLITMGAGNVVEIGEDLLKK